MSKIKTLFFFVAILLLALFLFSKFYQSDDINGDYIVRGNYDSTLSKLNNIRSLELFMTNEGKRLNVSVRDTGLMTELMDSILQMRFYHGTARYNMSENWLAYIMGELIWDDFRMMVISDELLTKKVAACNQISIIFHELLKKKQYVFRPVGLNNHMVTEVFYSDHWHMFDPDYEPKLDHQINVDELLKNRIDFHSIYEKTNGRFFNKSFDKILSTQEAFYFEKNVLLASNLKIFQQLTSFISKYGWMIFFMFGFVIHFMK